MIQLNTIKSFLTIKLAMHSIIHSFIYSFEK